MIQHDQKDMLWRLYSLNKVEAAKDHEITLKILEFILNLKELSEKNWIEWLTLKWSDVVCYLVNFEINIINKQIENLITINNLYIIR